MQVTKTNHLTKSTFLSSVGKNASCSRGWLRLTIQSIFAFITTASFILILLMALKNPTPSPAHRPASPPRCAVYNCRVVCNKAPYFGEYEEDILFAVTDAETKCNTVTLELNSPAFEFNTLPNDWLSRLRSNIYQLVIIGGNLMHITTGAFMTQFTLNMKTLELQALDIRTFESNSLVGLSELQTLNIVECQVNYFQANALRAVDDTLETLRITRNGAWNPVNVTGFRGFEKLAIVDFSYNNFNRILDGNSFVGLEYCKVIYLNSCGILAIGAGAFDSLLNIEVIYLHDNLLVMIPPGLFSHIALLNNPRPRISLQENFWHCDCTVDDLRQLVRKEIMLVEATCKYPSEMHGISFTEFEKYCKNDSDSIKVSAQNTFKGVQTVIDKVYINGSCSKQQKSGFRFKPHKSSLRLVYPEENNKCSLNISKHIDISVLLGKLNYNTITQHLHSRHWLKYSFFLKAETFSAIHIGATETKGYGLLWFQSECPSELYCMDTMPSFLRLYNIDVNAQYTFCPMRLSTGEIEDEGCIGYDMSVLEAESEGSSLLRVLVYITTVLICFCFGAAIVYGLIRSNPTLLKGSKRILFVKHKAVDALVLPPKVPLRNDLINNTTTDFKDKDIFTVCADDRLKLPKLNRMKSGRSNKSSAPSYISALQPTEDQLAEWRIRHHFNNNFTISSTKSERSALSWISSDTPYYSLDESDRTYESLK